MVLGAPRSWGSRSSSTRPSSTTTCCRGPHFSFPGPHAPQVEIFYSLYFAMTGLHASHMLIGIPLILFYAWQAHRGRFDESYNTPIELIGLYWHFVDIVWIYLFPLLYLIGRS